MTEEEFESATAVQSVDSTSPSYADLAQYVLDAVLGAGIAKTTTEQDGDRIVVHITAESEFVGKIVGKGGRTISAIRSVVRAAGLRHQDKVFLEVDD